MADEMKDNHSIKPITLSPTSHVSIPVLELNHQAILEEERHERKNDITKIFKEQSSTDRLNQKVLEYLESSYCIELNPLSEAIETSTLTTSFKRALLMYPIVHYVDNLTIGIKEEPFFKSELKQILTEIEEIRRTQLLEIEEYHRAVMGTSTNKEEILSEYRQEYTSAVDQIISQMKSSDERRLEAAMRTMESLENDEIKGGQARLLSLIETGVKCSEDAIEILKTKLTLSREEFISLRHSDTLLEKTAQISYEKVRDAYSHLLRLSHKRSTQNDLLWIELEAKGREWMMNEMKYILNCYRSSSMNTTTMTTITNDVEPSTQTDRVNQHRLAASRRLQKFGDRILASSQKQIGKTEHFSEISFRQKKNQLFYYKKKETEKLNEWLEMTERQIEEWYTHSLQQLSEKKTEILFHLQYLDFHTKKLTHLRRLTPRYYEILRNKSFDHRRNSVRSSVPGSMTSKKEIKKDSFYDEGRNGPPPVSMNLGTRLWNLSRSVGVDHEEGVLLLTQLLHTVHPDPLVLQRLSQQVAHYENILAKRK
jgi:hypothetical protein